jgi:hypothetical protein
MRSLSRFNRAIADDQSCPMPSARKPFDRSVFLPYLEPQQRSDNCQATGK